MRNLLIIAYYFPPARGGGSARPFALYKHLARYGIRPVVVTTGNFGTIPGERDVYRFDSILAWRRDGILGRKVPYRIAIEALKPFFSRQMVDLYWTRNAGARIEAIARREGAECVLATYPPLQGLLLGARVAGRLGIPFISDFRDGLAFEPLARLSPLQERIARRAERSVVERSARVITVGRTLTGYFERTYGPGKFFTVHNGFDADEIPAPVARGEDRRRRVVHFGNLGKSRPRDVAPLFRAIAALRNDGIIAGGDFELLLLGDHTAEERRLVDSMRLGDVVRVEGPVERAEGLRRIARTCDGLLFYGAPGGTTVISSKLFEYFALRKPILGICRGNEAARLIEETGTGEVCGFDVSEIRALFARFLAGSLRFRPDPARIARYESSRLAEEVGQLVLLASSGGGRPGADAAPS